MVIIPNYEYSTTKSKRIFYTDIKLKNAKAGVTLLSARISHLVSTYLFDLFASRINNHLLDLLVSIILHHFSRYYNNWTLFELPG